MINVIFLAQFLATIIAASFLTFVLIFDVQRGIGAFPLSFSSSTDSVYTIRAFSSMSFPILLYRLLTPFRVIYQIISFCFSDNFGMRFGISSVFIVAALLTATIQTFTYSIEIAGRWKKLGFTGLAALKWIGDVQHSVSLSLSHIWSSADGVSCRRFGLQSLADRTIITEVL